MRRLKARVHVAGTWYGPGDKVPPEVAKRIGTHAWEDDGAKPEPSGDGPPRSGRGSGRGAWAAFAEANGLDVGEDRTREQIIADLEERGVIQPEMKE